MPRYEFFCPTCAHSEERQYLSFYEMLSEKHDEGGPNCPNCQTQMERFPASPAFKVEGYNVKNGYAK